MKLALLSELNGERVARRAAIVVTDIATGTGQQAQGADAAGDPLKDLLEKHLRTGKSGMAETPQGRVFLTVHVPPPRLVLQGGSH